MRQLKYHEKKLLRKVDLLEWKGTPSQREHAITQKYFIEERETYPMYNVIVGKIKRLSIALAKLSDNEVLKQTVVKELTNKLYSAGIIRSKSLLECAKVGVWSFCERRLSTVVERTKMVPDIKTGVTFIKGGHVKVGTETVTEPSLLITRLMEDYVTWRDGSKVKETIKEFTQDK